jgi:hypothetical protein
MPQTEHEPRAQKIDITIARLRLLLADVAAKEETLAGTLRQFRQQLRKIVEFGLYGDSTLDATLHLMSEVQARIASTENTLRDLGLLKTRAARELESLQLTRRIEAAKLELRELMARQAELEAEGPLGQPDAEIAAQIETQIEALKHQIAEASEQAAKTISSR